MRGVFDDEELEPGQQGHDTELTLGSGTLLAVFFGLVLICGLCFGLGYAVGHRGAKSAAAAATTTPGEQEPLQASGSVPKPSAIAQDVAPPPAPASDANAAASSGTAPPGDVRDTPQSAAAPAQTVPSQQEQQQIRPALAQGANAPEPQPSATAVRPAVAPAGTIMVQVAAVANPDDAEVLLNALRKRNYPVTARHESADNLIHVRVGPFATRGEANQWQMKLLNDGYNAVVQP